MTHPNVIKRNWFKLRFFLTPTKIAKDSEVRTDIVTGETMVRTTYLHYKLIDGVFFIIKETFIVTKGDC